MSIMEPDATENVFEKNEPAAPAPVTVPNPTTGGSYIRNPEIGSLTPSEVPVGPDGVVHVTREPSQAAVPPAP